MTLDPQELDQYHHRIAGQPMSEEPDQAHKNSVIPYSHLPTEILRADGTCHVTMFTAGISTVLSSFIQHENAINPSNHLTEQEWLERFTKFVEDYPRKA